MLPAVPWLPLLGAAVLVLCLGILLFEARLAALGYQPTARDTPARWIAERTRAARLGERALILVGASRFQVGLDLDVLRRETGLEPVQLAIDGSASGAVLENLARDPAIRGTILLDYYGYGLGSDGVAAKWVQQYEKRSGLTDWLEHPAAASEAFLDDWLREHLRLNADGANPLYSLRFRIFADKPSAQYLVMRPDRSRLADYSRTAIPAAYYSRVARTLGESIDPVSPQVEELLMERIARLAPADPAPLDAAGAALAIMAAALQARGGRLAMVAMPTSGMVSEIEERRYPRTHFWERLVAGSGVAGIDARQDPGFGEYQCPDGSHLDARDRERFARELATALKQHGVGRP